MNTRKMFWGLALTFVFLAGCSKKKDLSEEEKVRFGDTLQSFTRITEAVHTAKTTPQSVNSSDPDQPANLTQIMAQRLLKSKGTCQLVYENVSNIGSVITGSVSSKAAKIQIQGESCPATLDAQFYAEALAGKKGARLKFTMKYEVRDEEYRRLNDVDGADLKGEILVEGEGNQAQRHGSVRGSVEGTIHSQIHGNVGIYFVANVDMQGSSKNMTGKMEVRFGIRYKDYDAEIAIISIGKFQDPKNMKYYLNDKEITKEEYSKIMRYPVVATAQSQESVPPPIKR